MVYPQKIKQIHEQIQKKIFAMVPEKWDRLYLYACVVDHPSNLQTGEMFFYYYPKGVLRKNPINVYEVPAKFNINETQYLKMADDLFANIKELRNAQIEDNERAWSNITIVIENLKYKAIFEYQNSAKENFDIYEKRIIWTYRYLKVPFESFNKSEREIIERFEMSEKQEETIFELPLYVKPLNKALKTIKDSKNNLEFVTEVKLEEMEFKKTHVPKSQILKK